MTENLHLDIKVVKGKGKGKFVFKETHRNLSIQEKLAQYRADKELDKHKLEGIKADFRKERNRLLLESDWTEMTKAAHLTEEKKKAWAIYRQQLRDMSKTIKDWYKIEWPKAPS